MGNLRVVHVEMLLGAGGFLARQNHVVAGGLHVESSGGDVPAPSVVPPLFFRVQTAYAQPIEDPIRVIPLALRIEQRDLVEPLLGKLVDLVFTRPRAALSLFAATTLLRCSSPAKSESQPGQ